MTRQELETHYWRAGSSGKNNPEARTAGVVGTFGIGAMANFGTAAKLEVMTESARTGERTLEPRRARDPLCDRRLHRCHPPKVHCQPGDDGHGLYVRRREGERRRGGKLHPWLRPISHRHCHREREAGQSSAHRKGSASFSPGRGKVLPCVPPSPFAAGRYHPFNIEVGRSVGTAGLAPWQERLNRRRSYPQAGGSPDPDLSELIRVAARA